MNLYTKTNAQSGVCFFGGLVVHNLAVAQASESGWPIPHHPPLKSKKPPFGVFLRF